MLMLPLHNAHLVLFTKEPGGARQSRQALACFDQTSYTHSAVTVAEGQRQFRPCRKLELIGAVTVQPGLLIRSWVGKQTAHKQAMWNL